MAPFLFLSWGFGRVVLHQRVETGRQVIDLSALGAGMYLVAIENNNSRSVQKLTITE